MRRAAASAALAVLTALIVVSGLDAVPGAGSVGKRVGRAAALAGVEQNWGVFAPTPRTFGLRLEADVGWSDGHHDTWRVPTGGPALPAYRDYRWRKWAEQTALDGRRLWRPAVLYIARQVPARPGATPVEVRLVRLTRALAAPGSHRRYPWRRQELYRASLGVERG